MLFLHAILFILLVFLPACTSSLGVKVEIFDPKGVTSDDARMSALQREGAKHAYLARSGQYSKAIDDLQTQLSTYIHLLSSPEISVMTITAAPKIEQTAFARVKDTITSAVQTRDAAMQDLRRAENLGNDREKLLSDASDHFITASKSLNELRSEILKTYQGPLRNHLASINSRTDLNTTEVDRITSKQKATDFAIEKNLQSLTGGQDLLDDSLAPIIIAAPSQYWKGIYNKTDATGTIGNTDIAIKMETIGTFTIKGIRLDASKVTEATFDVLKQSVRMVAAAYGIPTSADQTTGNSGDTGSPTNTVLSIDQMRQTAERKRLLSRTAALTILDLIVTQKDNLADNNKRKIAVQQLKKSFEAYKAQLTGA
jgi:hypothetical protein